MTVLNSQVAHNPIRLSQVDSSGSIQTNRRNFLASVATGVGAACLATTGCVPNGSIDQPELVWGRRGMSDGRFLKPRAITIDHNDHLYIVDTTGRIQVFDTDGQLLRWWKTPQTANGRPTGMATKKIGGVEGKSRLYVADTHYYRMLAYKPNGELINSEQIGGVAGHSPGEFAFVTDAVCDDEGCIYIGEYGASDRIQKFSPDGKFITQWGGNGHQPGKFVRPQSLVVDGNTLWVVDACNHRIQRFDVSEEKPRLIDVWGGEGKSQGKFYYPYDLAIASDSTVLICEYGNQRIQRFEPNGKWIASWGGPGFEPGQLYQPWGLVIDSIDRVHILDSNNHRVQRISLPS
ncbi:MAG: twin-arginine translocation signal domain-containing protein [Pirellulaceae bacterium]|nr:twin-arginine translocation signal domain-containing protein [Pirellulaceae bacterium]